MTETEAPRPAYSYLKAYLDRHGYTYSRFATSVGYDNSFISDICNGKIAISAELAHAIAKAHPKISALGLLVAQAKRQLYEIELHGPRKNRQGHKRPSGQPLDEDAVCRDRRNRMSIRAIARKHDAGYTKIRNILIAHGLLSGGDT